MARGVNKVILVGNLGNDPDTRYLQSGSAVTNVSLATTKAWKDRNTGENREATEWHRVVFFNRLAEIAGEYLKKGSKVYVEGELRTRQWERDGQKHYTTEIVASEMQMLDGRGDMAGGGGGGNSGGSNSGGGSSGGGYTSQSPSSPASGSNRGGGMDDDQGGPPPEDFDDDIPF